MPRKPKSPPSPVGFLVSQIGYDTGLPMRAIVRGDKKTLGKWAGFAVIDADNGLPIHGNVATYWGECWGSHWWIADFSDANLDDGVYGVGILDDDFPPDLVTVSENLLWDETAFYASVDQAERRQKLARDKVGWYDAGTAWQEANSHAALILGFCDMLEYAPERVVEYRDRLEAQILNGCDYLVSLQEKAVELPNGKGAVVHQIWKYDDLILPADVAKAAVAWARAGRLLSETHSAKKQEYLNCAERACEWLHQFTPQNVGGKGFSRINHGLPDDASIPDEWMTRDLLMKLWAVLELDNAGCGGYWEGIAVLSRQIMMRQIKQDEAQSELYGHFRTFANADYIEKAWTHHGDGGYGYDCGGTFPHWVLPLLWSAQKYPEHPEAAQWEQCVRDFAYGYLLPACRSNPFNLLPLGEVSGEGIISFAGLWHGMNAAYALTAAQAVEFAKYFDDPAFLEIAAGNLQWIAGLNAGITKDSLFASHMFSMDIPEGIALPVSMICGIGERTAGNWMQIRGSICNGFSTGDQFRFDVRSEKANDTPSAFTDEDWITHAGGWLSALSRL